jgi:hypothetical protein
MFPSAPLSSVPLGLVGRWQSSIKRLESPRKQRKMGVRWKWAPGTNKIRHISHFLGGKSSQEWKVGSRWKMRKVLCPTRD